MQRRATGKMFDDQLSKAGSRSGHYVEDGKLENSGTGQAGGLFRDSIIDLRRAWSLQGVNRHYGSLDQAFARR